MHLRPEQIAELFQDACSECGFFTVGPVSTPKARSSRSMSRETRALHPFCQRARC